MHTRSVATNNLRRFSLPPSIRLALRKHRLLTATEETAIAEEIWANRLDAWEIVLGEDKARDRLLAVLRDAGDSPNLVAAIERGDLREAATCDVEDRVLRLAVCSLPSAAKARARRRLAHLDAAVRTLENHNIPLVLALILRKFTKHIDGVHFEVGDLLGYGAIGLRSAALRFDPARGNRFSTCAFPWIRHHIGRAIQDSGRTIRIPVHLSDKIEKVAKARDWLRAMGAEQTVEAIAEASGLSVREVMGCLAAPLPPVSLSAPRAFDHNNEDQSTLQDHIADRDSPMPDEGLSNADEQALMDDVMMVMEDALSPSERRILLARSGMDATTFGEDPTLAEVGVQIGVSRERVRQLQNQAIRKVRDHFPARAAEAMTC